MEIVSLVLEGYERFQLKQIKYFKYEPKKKTQVIVGTNGSGKSSLIWELSPLPAHHSCFPKGGRKEIEILANGAHYLLQSIVEGSDRRYCFIKDGENLNPGFTMTVYLELVKEHLRYTPELHKLFTGQTVFHRMTVAERRNWFTLIGDVDYTYAYKYYQTIRENIRSLKGSIDVDQARLVQETSKRLDPEQREVLSKEHKTKRAILDDLLAASRSQIGKDSLESRLEALRGIEDSILKNCSSIVEYVQDSGGLSSEEVDAMERRLAVLEKKQHGLQQAMSARFETSEKLRKQLDSVSSAGSHNLSEIQRDIRELDDEAREIERHLDVSLSFEDPRAALSAYHSCQQSIEEVLTGFHDLPKLNYSRDEYQSLLEKQTAAKGGLLHAKAYEADSLQKKQHMEAHMAEGEVECPACRHKWSPSKSLNYKEVCANHQQALQLVEKAETTIKETEDLLVNYVTYIRLMKWWDSLKSQFPALGCYWGIVSADNSFYEEPGKALERFRSLLREIESCIKRDELLKRIKELQTVEKVMLDNSKLNVEQTTRDYQEIQLKMEMLTVETRSVSLEIASLEKSIAMKRRVDRQIDSVMKAMDDRKKRIEECLDDSVSALMGELIHQLRNEVSSIERRLVQVDLQEGVIQRLSQAVETAKKDMDLLKLSEKALSPKEGLIAKGMTNFINQFIESMNAYIEEIWSYPLSLKPINYSSDEKLDLDYNFSVRINDSFETDDISQTSDGIRAIIDRAFIDVVMRYLRLDGYPVWLDEFARAFDPKHREQAYSYIESLVDSDRYSQVFMVSHYQDGYGSLTNAEFVVLCDANMALPKHLEFNTAVEMR